MQYCYHRKFYPASAGGLRYSAPGVYNLNWRLGLASGQAKDEQGLHESPDSDKHRVVLGEQMCPRCRKFFTASYWTSETMIQARCLSCDLKWPRPDVV